MPLHQSDVIDGALELLDVEGLDGLTMRRLATSLSVQPGALYWHFASKRALLGAMTDRMLADVPALIPDGTWVERLTALALRYRTALLAHRDGARVAGGSFVPQTNTIETGRAFVTVLTAAGVPAEQAGWTWSTIKYYVLGHCIEEQVRLQLEADGEWDSLTAAAARSVDDAQDPVTATALRALVATDPRDQFTHGLMLIVAGVEASIRNGDPDAASTADSSAMSSARGKRGDRDQLRHT